MGRLVLIFLVCLIRSEPAFGDDVRLSTLPRSFQLYQSAPKSLQGIEELIQYRWFEKAWEGLKDYPADEETVLFLKSKSLLGMKRYKEAYRYLYWLSRKAADQRIRGQSVFLEAKALSRSGEYAKALKLYESFMKKSKGRGSRRQFAWAAVKTALEGKEYRKGLKYLRHLSGPKAIWYRGWCHYRLNNLSRALRSWQQMDRKRDTDYYQQTLYWQAQILKRQGKSKKANALLTQLIQEYPITYYSFLAIFELFPSRKEREKAIQHYWAERVENGKRVGFPSVEGDFRVRWEKWYPKHHFKIIQKETRKRRLDPYLILSLVRQESYFQEAVISQAGAVGLMQLMPQTAVKLAKAARKKKFELQSIFDPKINVHLGCLYVKFLKMLFSDRIPLVLASYNAGEEAVSRWQTLREGESDLFFIEEIPYDETQQYVKKIFKNYWVYYWLYEGQLPADVLL